MHPVNSETLLENLNWRYACKKFDPSRKIPDATWATLEAALALSPSSYGLQPWKFLVIRDPALRAKLREASYNQSQITDASHLVIIARKVPVLPADIEAYVARTAEVRNIPVETLADFKKMMLGGIERPATLPGGSMDTYTRSQTYIALGFLLYTAAQLGVDACPMEGFDAAKYEEILGLTQQNLRASVVAAVGYRAADDWLAPMAKVRAKPEDLFIRH